VTDAFIFDLDGTLIDSETLWCTAAQRLVQSRGLPMTDAYSRELVFGKAWSDIVSRLRRDYPAVQGTDAEIEAECQAHYEALRGVQDIRIPSSIRLLQSLSLRYPVAIVSGSTRKQVADAVEMMGIGPHLRFFLGSEDYPRGKPDPTCFLLAARRLAVEPANCLVFEDSTAGVRAAIAAGMYCIALKRNGHCTQDLSAAHQVLTDLALFDAKAYGLCLEQQPVEKDTR
jgi:HAD superfamily hydrolase (TIGR01509 family)